MSRYYKINGLEMVSVTTVLKDVLNAAGLNNWRVKEGIKTAIEQTKLNPNITADEILQLKKDELDKTGNRGTDIHVLIANAQSKKIDINSVLTDEYKGYVECYNKWIDDINPLPPLFTEKQVSHPELHYAGTLDGVYPIEMAGAIVTNFDKGITEPMYYNVLVDVKTGYVNDITGLQLTAYEYALKYNNPEIKIQEKRILKLDKTGDYDRDKNWIKTDEPLENWKQLLNLWWCYYASKKFKKQWGV